MSNESIDVKVGQIWADNDWRCEGREVRVLAVDETHATVQSPSGHGRKTRIRLDRFRPTSTGYRLVRDPNPRADHDRLAADDAARAAGGAA